jgi:plastocyanin
MRLLTATTAALAIASIAFAGIATPKNKVLKGTTGPGFVITTKTPAGKSVKTTKAGKYNIVVADRSAIHNYRLRGPGVNKEVTKVGFRGMKTVTVTLKAGKYRFQCDPHALDMKGSFTVTS